MQSEIEKIAAYGDPKREAMKYLVQVREWCIEMAIYNLSATEENAVKMASKLEKYLLNGETDSNS